jgi:D-glycero-D-manno-heptose 1,7-bisphosphate phosphatase
MLRFGSPRTTGRSAGGASAVFFDRDGTLTAKPPAGQHVRHPDQLRLLPGASAAVRAVNRAGALAVLVTNQRWLTSAEAGPSAFAAIDARLCELLAKRGAHLDVRYVCPHERGTCTCRKPAPGMLLQAAEELGLDLGRCTLIGDMPSDAAAGRAAGVRCLRIALRPDETASGVMCGDREFPTVWEAVNCAL